MFSLLLLLFLIHTKPSFAVVPAIEIDKSDRTLPNEIPKHWNITSKEAYSNDPGQDDTYMCTFSLPISNTFNPKESTASGSTAKSFVPYEVNEVKTDFQFAEIGHKNYKNQADAIQRTEVRTDQTKVQQSFLSIDTGTRLGTSFKSLSSNEQCLHRSNNITDIVSTVLVGKASNNFVQDLQIALNCNGKLTDLSSNSSGCTPVSISEVYYGLLNYKWEIWSEVEKKYLPRKIWDPILQKNIDMPNGPPFCVKEDGQIRRIPIPANIVNALISYFTTNSSNPPSYSNRYNKSFSTLGGSTYAKIFYQLPIISNETAGVRVKIYDFNKLTGQYVLHDNKPIDVGYPALGNGMGNIGEVVSISIPSKQKLDELGDPCQAIALQAVEDHPEPASWFKVFVNGLKELIEDKTRTITESTKGEINIPSSITKNDQKDLNALYMYITAADKKKFNFQSISYSATTQSDPRPIPGYRIQMVRQFLHNNLVPKSWQKPSSL